MIVLYECVRDKETAFGLSLFIGTVFSRLVDEGGWPRYYASMATVISGRESGRNMMTIVNGF